MFNLTASSYPIDMVWDGYGFNSGSMNTFFYQPNLESIFFIPQIPANMDVYKIDEKSDNITLDKNYLFPNYTSFEETMSKLKRNDMPNVFDLLMGSEFAYNMYSYMRNDCYTFFSFSRTGPHYRVVIDDNSPNNFYISNELMDNTHGNFHPYPIWNSSHLPLSVNLLHPNDIHKEDFDLGIDLRDKVEMDDNPVLGIYEMKPCP